MTSKLTRIFVGICFTIGIASFIIVAYTIGNEPTVDSTGKIAQYAIIGIITLTPVTIILKRELTMEQRG